MAFLFSSSFIIHLNLRVVYKLPGWAKDWLIYVLRGIVDGTSEIEVLV